MKNKIENLIEEFYVPIGLCSIFLQVLMLIFKINWMFSFCFALINLFCLLLVKNKLKDNHKKTGFFFFHLSTILLIINICMSMCLMIATGIIDGISKNPEISNLQNVLSIKKSFSFLAYLLGICGSLAYITFLTKEKGKAFVEHLDKLDLIKRNNDTNEPKKGDIVLGLEVDKDTGKLTGKKIILALKDRFLHMLAIGATGTGKTSQIILPMILQDMQNDDCGITILEPKADLAEKAYAMAKEYNRDVLYFNPILPDCPYFNPLHGPEELVIENMATTFRMLEKDGKGFFLDMADTLIRQGLKVVKRLYGNDATLLDFSTLINNYQNNGKMMVNDFKKIATPTPELAKENADIAAWFIDEYFNEKGKTYEHCSGLRSKMTKITSNKFLRKVLNPPKGASSIDFASHLESNGVLAIATAQGVLGELGNYLGYFIILNFQSAVMKRPGNENTRRSHFFYIDEVQVYANSGMSNLLTQGRSYRVASLLATQNTEQLGMNSGSEAKAFVSLVMTNARNQVIFPGCGPNDAKLFSSQFGDIEVEEVGRSVSSDIFNPMRGFYRSKYDKQSLSYKKTIKKRFSESDIIFRPFGEVIVRLINNSTLQYPSVTKIQYIPRELNEKLDQMVAEYNTEQFEKAEALEQASLSDDIGNKQDKTDMIYVALTEDDLDGDGDGISQNQSTIINSTTSEVSSAIENLDEIIIDDILDEDF